MIRKRLPVIWVVVSILYLLAASSLHAQTKACDLLTAAELEAALGGKAGALSESNLGAAHICSGSVGKMNVMIRFGERKSGSSGDAERKGIEAARQMGAKVQVKTEGDLTCSTMIPPESMAQYGYNTTCTILREGVVVGVEVTATSQQGMATTEAVKGLAQKARSRL
jgi:hypothetical protein